MSLFEAELPMEWSWRPLHEGFEITRRRPNAEVEKEDGVFFVPMNAVPAAGDHRLRFERRVWHDVKSGTFFAQGDILLPKITPSFENGKQGMAVGLAASFGLASTELIPIHARSPRDSSWFLFYYLLHPEVRAQLTGRMEGSTGRQRVPDEAVLELLVPAPPREEQDRIASALFVLQESLRLEERIIDTTTILKEATLNVVFTHGLRGEAQKDTEVGPIPESWRAIPLGPSLKRAQYGLSVKGQGSGQYPILRMNCQIDGRVAFRDLQHVDLDPRTFEAFRLDHGDLLFNRTNSYELVGRTAIFRSDRDAVFASYLIRLTLDTDVFVPEFVNYFLGRESAQAELKKLASRGVSQANISASKLKGFIVPWAPMDEQREVVEIIQAIERKIDLHRRKRDLLADLFRSLLHKLMTGEVRVADLDMPPDLAGTPIAAPPKLETTP